MLKKVGLVSAVLLFVISLCVAGSGPDMKPGLWEITTKMEMPGMPMSMPASTHTQCLTKQDMVPSGSQENENCKAKSIKITGNTVKWEIVCKTEGGVSKGKGKITYSGNKFKGTLKMTVKNKGQREMKMISHISGRRIGKCKQIQILIIWIIHIKRRGAEDAKNRRDFLKFEIKKFNAERSAFGAISPTGIGSQ